MSVWFTSDLHFGHRMVAELRGYASTDAHDQEIVDRWRTQAVHSCDEEVTRDGQLEPCEKRAVAVRRDPEDGSPYAVCAYHARGDMVPLGELLAGLS